MIRPDWLGPYWFERQTDPDSADFVPAGAGRNLTHRSWTSIGTLSSSARGTVDPRGLVTPGGDWSLDWWIGAEDRWHVPSREIAVRQRLVDGAPVVETSMRVPGGDVAHRAYAARAGGADVIVVEVENRTPVPVALALAVRPVHPARAGRIDSITHDDTRVEVDGAVALLFAKAPARAALADGDAGDTAHTVFDGLADAAVAQSVSCRRGLASAGFVVPLAHSATVRVVVPIGAGASPDSFPDDVPPLEAVARGWAVQADRGARFSVPEDHLQEVFDASRRYLLQQVVGDEVVAAAGEVQPWVETARVLTALDHLGYHDEARSVLASIPDIQTLRGAIADPVGDTSATAAVLHSLATHVRLSGDGELASELIGPVAKASHWVAKRHEKDDRRGSTTGSELVWALRGQRDTAALTVGIDQPGVAEDAAARAAALEPALADLRDVSDLLLAGELGVLDPTAEAVTGALEVLRERATLGAAVIDLRGANGLSPAATLALATVELRRGDREALDRLGWLLETSSPTWTWPEIVHPRTLAGSYGSGHHGPTLAAFCTFVRRLLVDETADGLALCSLVPDSWLGQPIEVRDAPTAFGRLGFAIRWHGDRPALLWELDPADGATVDAGRPAVLTVAGLDPTWRTTELSGEALLAPVAPRDTPGTRLGGPGVDGRDEPDIVSTAADGTISIGESPVFIETTRRTAPEDPHGGASSSFG